MAYNVLIVEDDKDVVDLYRAEFSPYTDTNLIVAKNGLVAMEMVKSAKFDAIFMDLRLPGCNGMQIIHTIRDKSINKETPVYIVSGFIDLTTIQMAENLKVTATLDKPMMNFEKTIEEVRQLMGNLRPMFTMDKEMAMVLVAAAKVVLTHYLGAPPAMGHVRMKKPTDPARGQVTSVIAFTGEGIKGSLALSANLVFVQKLAKVIFPQQQIQLDKDMAKDMMGELCNQVIGHLKTLFKKRNKKVTIGLPAVFVSRGLNAYHTEKTPIMFVPMGLDKIGVDVELAMTSCPVEQVAEEEATPAEQEEASEDAAAGDVLLF